MRESRLDSPVCPVCRQDISAVCPGVCRRMEATISVLFPDKLTTRVAEVELHKRQHAEVQAQRDAQHAHALRRLYGRIMSLISTLRPTGPERSQSGGVTAGAATAEPVDGAASEGDAANNTGDDEGDPMDAATLARTLDSFMNTAVSSNAWQDGPPLLTLVFTIGRNGEPGPRGEGLPREADGRNPRLANPMSRRPWGRAPSQPSAPRRSTRLRNRQTGEGPSLPEEGPESGGSQ